jgi:hypothetical protein
MLVSKCSLLNKEYVLINTLEALDSIIFMCSLHVIFLSNITHIYFALFCVRSEQHCTPAVHCCISDPTENTVLVIVCGSLRSNGRCLVCFAALPNNGFMCHSICAQL